MATLEELFAKRPAPISPTKTIPPQHSCLQQPTEPVVEKRRPDIDVTQSVFYSATRRPTLPEFLHTNSLQLPQFRFVWEKAAGNLDKSRQKSQSRGESLHAVSKKRQKTAPRTENKHKENSTWSQLLSDYSKFQLSCAAEGEEKGSTKALDASSPSSSQVTGTSDEIINIKQREIIKQTARPRVRKVVRGGSIVTIVRSVPKQSTRGENAKVTSDENAFVVGKSVTTTQKEQAESSVHEDVRELVSDVADILMAVPKETGKIESAVTETGIRCEDVHKLDLDVAADKKMASLERETEKIESADTKVRCEDVHRLDSDVAEKKMEAVPGREIGEIESADTEVRCEDVHKLDSDVADRKMEAPERETEKIESAVTEVIEDVHKLDSDVAADKKMESPEREAEKIESADPEVRFGDVHKLDSDVADKKTTAPEETGKIESAVTEVRCEDVHKLDSDVADKKTAAPGRETGKFESAVIEVRCDDVHKLDSDVADKKTASLERETGKIESADTEVRCEDVHKLDSDVADKKTASLERETENIESAVTEVRCEDVHKLDSDVADKKTASLERETEKIESAVTEVRCEDVHKLDSDVADKKIESPEETGKIESADTEVRCEDVHKLDSDVADKKTASLERETGKIESSDTEVRCEDVHKLDSDVADKKTESLERETWQIESAVIEVRCEYVHKLDSDVADKKTASLERETEKIESADTEVRYEGVHKLDSDVADKKTASLERETGKIESADAEVRCEDVHRLDSDVADKKTASLERETGKIESAVTEVRCEDVHRLDSNVADKKMESPEETGEIESAVTEVRCEDVHRLDSDVADKKTASLGRETGKIESADAEVRPPQTTETSGHTCSPLNSTTADDSVSDTESLAELVMADSYSDSDGNFDIGSHNSESEESELEDEEDISDVDNKMPCTLKESSPQVMATCTKSASQNRRNAKKKRKVANQKKNASKRKVQHAKQAKQGQNATVRVTAPHRDLRQDRWTFNKQQKRTSTIPGCRDSLLPCSSRIEPPRKQFKAAVSDGYGTGPNQRARDERGDFAVQVTGGNVGLNVMGSTQDTLLSSVADCAVDVTVAACEKEPVTKKSRGGKKKKKNKQYGERRSPRIILETKVAICKFYQEGRCQKGESCTFRHEGPVTERLHGKKKCKYYAGSQCYKNNCIFMHNSFPCRFFHTSSCKGGANCKFSHATLTSETRRLLDEDIQECISQGYEDTQTSGAAGGMTLRSRALSPDSRDKHVHQSAVTADYPTSVYNLRATNTRKRRASEEQSSSDAEKGKYGEEPRKKIGVQDGETPVGFLPGMYRDMSQ